MGALSSVQLLPVGLLLVVASMRLGLARLLPQQWHWPLEPFPSLELAALPQAQSAPATLPEGHALLQKHRSVRALLKDPCKAYKCPVKGQICSAGKNGKAKCSCPTGQIKDAIKGCIKTKNPFTKPNSEGNSNQASDSAGGCPEGSVLKVQAGVNTCDCQNPSSHWVDGICKTGALPHADFLDAHNNARAYLGAKSLAWNDAAAQSAQNWADTLKATPGCPMNHPDNIDTTYPYGQNLARTNAVWGSAASPEYAVSLWVAEGTKYTRSPVAGGCKTGKWNDCGHFTQLVWNTTTSVGCGKSQCPDGSMLWVCEYDPPGNWNGEFPFRRV